MNVAVAFADWSRFMDCNLPCWVTILRSWPWPWTQGPREFEARSLPPTVKYLSLTRCIHPLVAVSSRASPHPLHGFSSLIADARNACPFWPNPLTHHTHTSNRPPSAPTASHGGAVFLVRTPCARRSAGKGWCHGLVPARSCERSTSCTYPLGSGCGDGRAEGRGESKTVARKCVHRAPKRSTQQ